MRMLSSSTKSKRNFKAAGNDESTLANNDPKKSSMYCCTVPLVARSRVKYISGTDPFVRAYPASALSGFTKCQYLIETMGRSGGLGHCVLALEYRFDLERAPAFPFGLELLDNDEPDNRQVEELMDMYVWVESSEKKLALLTTRRTRQTQAYTYRHMDSSTSFSEKPK